MITRRFSFLFAFASLVLAGAPVLAHHSASEYDMSAVSSIKGTVTRFEWNNPHAYIYVETKDDKGNAAEWMAEMPSVGMLARVNWRKDTVKPGDEITIVGNRAKNAKLAMRLEKVVFSNGQELSTRLALN